MIRSILWSCQRTELVVMLSDSRGIIGKIQEERNPLHASVLLKVAREESTRLHVDTHGRENDGEVVLVSVMNTFCGFAYQACLSTYLCGDLVMWKTGGGEDGNLLSSGDGIHGVNGRNTCRNHLLRVHLAWSEEARAI